MPIEREGLKKYEFVAPKSLGGIRLDRAISMLIDCGRKQARQLVEEGCVKMNKKLVNSASVKLEENDLIELEFSGESFTEQPPEPDPEIVFEVVHEDTNFLVVNKPVGLVVHPGAGNPDKTLVNGLLTRYPEIASVGESDFRPGIVHRLDKDTSGLMLVARSQDAYENFKQAIAEREVVREYGVICHGVLLNSNGVIDAPLARSNKNRLKMSVQSDGKPARTHYELIQELDNDIDKASLIYCHLETGRTHQIRVHLASIGHAVWGDSIYVPQKKSKDKPQQIKNSQIKDSSKPTKASPQSTSDTFLALYARRLKFRHPISGDSLEFELAMPAPFRELLSNLSAAGK